MEIIFRVKNVDITDHIKTYAEEKLTSAFHVVPHIIEKNPDRCVLEIEFEKITGEEKGKIFRTEAQAKLPGISIKAEDIAENFKTSIDEVHYELERQLKEYKEKKEAIYKKGAREAKEQRIEE